MAKKTEKTVHHNISGWIVQGRDGDYDKALYLIDHRIDFENQPLADIVYDLASYGRKPISISYHITDEPRTEEELILMTITKLAGVSISGDSKIEYYHRYSEPTGYLWTNEYLVVGGHDVLAELRSYRGKWCHLMIKVHG